MPVWTHRFPALFLLLALLGAGCKKTTPPVPTDAMRHGLLNQLGIAVDASENREFAYTDKRSGYFYGTTHTRFNDLYFSGWNIATKRVLRDYQLFANDEKLDRRQAKATVFPHLLQRSYPQGTEQLMLFDDVPAIGIQMSDLKTQRVGIAVAGDLCRFSYQSTQGAWYMPLEATRTRILITTWNKSKFDFTDGVLSAPADCGGFLLIHGNSKAEILATLENIRTHTTALLTQRWDRMEQLAEEAISNSGQDSLDHALAWLTLTLDQLITQQQGPGIYAGLPWFNDYWGRDLFVSLPGACLVNGQFEMAKQILRSFSKLQDTNPKSRYYGRIPNRARPDGLIYNTADGTPRFVAQIAEYVRYTGDTAILPELYPAVKRSVEGALQYWTSPQGYLLHDDADTWMDAKIKGKTPYSPRGNRANDIQALWVAQLRTASQFAAFNGDDANQKKWTALADKVSEQFERDFLLKKEGLLADHLNADGSQDRQMRPNQLFALPLLTDEALKRRIVKSVWQALAYPWGIASLSQQDSAFHPYHEHWNYYHKDAAYHNGTVWLWLNGIAMQRMIEAGQTERAFSLFQHMNRQALQEGAVGCLSENADALPQEGKTRGKISGAFLQAWSNAEQLRVWHQHFLGIQPNLFAGHIALKPAIPSAIPRLQCSSRIGKGRLQFAYSATGAAQYAYTPTGFSPTLIVQLPAFPAFKKQVPDGATLQVRDQADFLEIRLLQDGKVIESFEIEAAVAERTKINDQNEFFRGTQYCKPLLQPGLKALQVFHDPPLTY